MELDGCDAESVSVRSGRSRPSDKEGGHPGPEIRGRDGVQKKFFSALWASVWSKNRGGGDPLAPPLDPPLV